MQSFDHRLVCYGQTLADGTLAVSLPAQELIDDLIRHDQPRYQQNQKNPQEHIEKHLSNRRRACSQTGEPKQPGYDGNDKKHCSPLQQRHESPLLNREHEIDKMHV